MRRSLVIPLAAVLLIASAAVVFAAGGGDDDPQPASTVEDVSGPCDEAEHADGPSCPDDQVVPKTTAGATTTPTRWARRSPALR